MDDITFLSKCIYYFYDGYCKYTPTMNWDGLLFQPCNYKCELYTTHKQKPTRNISRGVRYDVLKRQNWKCNICGCVIKYGKKSKWEGEIAHIDHIYPFTKWKTYDGYINELSNLQALCPSCNLKKNKKVIN